MILYASFWPNVGSSTQEDVLGLQRTRSYERPRRGVPPGKEPRRLSRAVQAAKLRTEEERVAWDDVVACATSYGVEPHDLARARQQFEREAKRLGLTGADRTRYLADREKNFFSK